MLILSGCHLDIKALELSCKTGEIPLIHFILDNKIMPNNKCFQEACLYTDSYSFEPKYGYYSYKNKDKTISKAKISSQIIDMLIGAGYKLKYDDVIFATQKKILINNFNSYNIKLDGKYLETCSEVGFYPYDLSYIEPTIKCLEIESGKSGNMQNIRKLISTYNLKPNIICLRNACSISNNLHVIKYLIETGNLKIDKRCIYNLLQTINNNSLNFVIREFIDANEIEKEIQKEKELEKNKKIQPQITQSDNNQNIQPQITQLDNNQKIQPKITQSDNNQKIQAKITQSDNNQKIQPKITQLDNNQTIDFASENSDISDNDSNDSISKSSDNDNISKNCSDNNILSNSSSDDEYYKSESINKSKSDSNNINNNINNNVNNINNTLKLIPSSYNFREMRIIKPAILTLLSLNKKKNYSFIDIRCNLIKYLNKNKLFHNDTFNVDTNICKHLNNLQLVQNKIKINDLDTIVYNLIFDSNEVTSSSNTNTNTNTNLVQKKN
jgi:hypothetical protein